MRENEFGRGAWVLGHLEPQDLTNLKEELSLGV